MTRKLTTSARETAAVYESEFPGEPLDAGWLDEAYQIDAAAGKIGRTSYAVYARACTQALDALRHAKRSAAARVLGARGGAARTQAKASASRANGRRGGRPVILGTIATEAGRGTVRYAPGRGRVEVVLPDGTVEVPEEAAVSSLDEARKTATAWYGRGRVWDWQPR